MADARAADTIGLALIARDEEATLPRLLATCDGAFDEVVLADTGSTDATVERFTAWAETQPGTHCRVERFAWCDDFARARQFADEQLASGWRVWADCDDEIRNAGALRGLVTGADPAVAGFLCAYDYAHARGESGEPRFVLLRERVVRAGRGRWVGKVHEVQVVDGPLVEVDPSHVLWVHHGDSGSEAATGRPRAIRDLEMLDAALREDPYDLRSLFYLAQTHRELGHHARALEFYERRARLGGWDEEVYQSLFHVGLLKAELGDWPGAMAALIDAWEARPWRAEPLYEIAWRLREREQYRSALLFAQRGLHMPEPADRLFVQRWVYRYGLRFEYSMAAYWAGDVAAALEVCEQLLALPDLPESYRVHTLANRAFCVEKLRRGGRG